MHSNSRARARWLGLRSSTTFRTHKTRGVRCVADKAMAAEAQESTHVQCHRATTPKCSRYSILATQRGKNENGDRASSEELQDCAAYHVTRQRQRPRGEAAEGKASSQALRPRASLLRRRRPQSGDKKVVLMRQLVAPRPAGEGSPGLRAACAASAWRSEPKGHC